LPDARNLKLDEIYTLLTSTYTDLVPTAEELIEKNWIQLIRAGIVSIDTSGQLEWGTDAAGRREVIDQYTGNIDTITTRLYYHSIDQIHMARIVGEGESANTTYTAKLAKAQGTVAGGAGAIAATDIIAAVAGKQFYCVSALLSLSTDTASGGILITIQDEDGTALTQPVVITINQPTFVIPTGFFIISPTANKKIQMVGDVGTCAALANADTVDVTLLYFEI
jgi:hypothetical protein